MADSVASPPLQALCDRWISVGHALGDERIMRKTRLTLTKFLPLVREAEERSVESSDFQKWISNFKDVAYDADDLLDDCEQLMLTLNKKSMVSNCFSLSSENPVFHLFQIRREIENIQYRFEKLLESRIALGGKIKPATKNSSTIVSSKETAFTSHTNDISGIFGRNVEKDVIVRMLVGSSEQTFCVVPIMGMGGIGKTTVARLVFNDVKSGYHYKFWVSVGEKFDINKIAKEIAHASGSSLGKDELDSFVGSVLKDKKFLIVLDDVQRVDNDEWSIIRRWFRVGARGSGVIVTTSNVNVPKIIGPSVPYYLGCLSDDDSWALLKHRAFSSMEGKDAGLVEIGVKLVGQCGGYPLAVDTLASLFQNQRKVSEWLSIKNLDLWRLPEFQDTVVPVLKASYDHLHSHLKQCFAYCSVYPNGYKLDKEKLIRLWIAEGFVQLTGGSKGLEEIANDYFMELLQLSFFKVISRDYCGEILECQMNSLVHELARSISRFECSIVKDEKSKNVAELRYSSLLCESVPSTLPRSLQKAKKLRALLLLSGKFKTIPSIFLEFGRLRVLNLSRSGICEVSASIGNLNHLRYLDLSCTYIETIPESICNLKYLQALELSACYNLQELPKAICRLTNLRHLDVSSCCSLTHMPSGIGKLPSLQNLQTFILGKSNDCAYIRELEGLDLRGKLEIKNLENVRSFLDAQVVKLWEKLKLQSLVLSWGQSSNGRITVYEHKVLESLKPPPGLIVLELSGYNGSRFPSWIGMQNLVKFCLKNCSAKELPPLGQLPFLKDIYIKGLPSVRTIGYEFYGDLGFPLLERLELYDMPNLLEWQCFKIDQKDSLITIGESSYPTSQVAFPCLDQLTVKGCTRLITLPLIPNLKSLALWSSNVILLRSLTHLTSLSSLVIKEFREQEVYPQDLGGLNSIRKLTIYDCNKLDSLFEGMQGLTSLQHLNILYCDTLTSLPLGMRCLTSIEKLCIVECENLASISDIVQYFSPLKELVIEGCPRLESFPVSMDNPTSV